MGISALVSPIHIVSMISSSRDDVAGIPFASYVFGIPKCTVRSQLWFVCQDYLQTAPSMLAKESWKDGSGGKEYPGGLVINGSPTQKPSPMVQSLPAGLGEPAAVMQASHQRGSSAPPTAAAPCWSCSALGSVSPGESNVMSSKVTPSRPMHSPVCRARWKEMKTLERLPKQCEWRITPYHMIAYCGYTRGKISIKRASTILGHVTLVIKNWFVRGYT